MLELYQCPVHLDASGCVYTSRTTYYMSNKSGAEETFQLASLGTGNRVLGMDWVWS